MRELRAAGVAVHESPLRAAGVAVHVSPLRASGTAAAVATISTSRSSVRRVVLDEAGLSPPGVPSDAPGDASASAGVADFLAASFIAAPSRAREEILRSTSSRHGGGGGGAGVAGVVADVGAGSALGSETPLTSSAFSPAMSRLFRPALTRGGPAAVASLSLAGGGGSRGVAVSSSGLRKTASDAAAGIEAPVGGSNAAALTSGRLIVGATGPREAARSAGASAGADGSPASEGVFGRISVAAGSLRELSRSIGEPGAPDSGANSDAASRRLQVSATGPRESSRAVRESGEGGDEGGSSADGSSRLFVAATGPREHARAAAAAAAATHGTDSPFATAGIGVDPSLFDVYRRRLAPGASAREVLPVAPAASRAPVLGLTRSPSRHKKAFAAAHVDAAQGRAGNSLDAPLPRGWRSYASDAGDEYFVSDDGATTTWLRPTEAAARSAEPGEEGEAGEVVGPSEAHAEGVTDAIAVARNSAGSEAASDAVADASFENDAGAVVTSRTSDDLGLASSSDSLLPAGWAAYADGSGNTYYVSSDASVTTWDRPTHAWQGASE